MPEISLTPQTIQAFQGRSGSVAVLHSHLQNAERGGHWRKIAAGRVQVVVGARSAVFAPTRNLGLIVIDEEHETTFKQEATPRYHARDVAVMRARFENIPIILGSATPSLESWHNAERGQYTLLSLPRRVHDRPLPHVHLIDLRHDRHPDRRLHGLSPSLERAMTQGARRGRAGYLAAQSARVCHLHSLPVVRARGAVPFLRPGSDVSQGNQRGHVPLLRLRGGAGGAVSGVQPGPGPLSGNGDGKAARRRLRPSSPAGSCSGWTATRCSGRAAIAGCWTRFAKVRSRFSSGRK